MSIHPSHRRERDNDRKLPMNRVLVKLKAEGLVVLIQNKYSYLFDKFRMLAGRQIVVAIRTFVRETLSDSA